MIGVLALQGGFCAHAKHLTLLQQPWSYVRTADEISCVDGLIIPGGESTTLLKLMTPELESAIITHHVQQKPILATCAGVILIAKNVSPTQHCLGLLDATVHRNAYGRQQESFTTEAKVTLNSNVSTVPLVFIRAPKIIDCSEDVKVLSRFGQDIVFVQQDNILAASFHPELTDDLSIHEYFLSLVKDSFLELV